MLKFKKGFSLIVAIIISVLFLCADSLYSHPLSKDFIRVPVGRVYDRIVEVIKDKEIRFATEEDAEAVSKANNIAWKGNSELQVIPDIASYRIKKDKYSCIISDMPAKGVTGVLWTARINTQGKPTALDPAVLWNRLTKDSPESKPDTLICYAIGVKPEFRGKKGGDVFARLISEAKEIAAIEKLRFVYTLSPTPRFEEFKAQYGTVLKGKGIPEELWIYAYLISVEGGGPFPYLDHLKDRGEYISISDYIKSAGTRIRLYCPTEGFHVGGNGAKIGAVLKNARPDCEYSIMYLYVNPESYSDYAGIKEKIMEILQLYIKTTSSASILNHIPANTGL